MPTELPLHPALVHLPLGASMLVPLVALALTVALWRRWWPRSTWAVVVALQLCVVGGGWLALLTGEQEEDRVERVVPHSAIETHEERAELFVGAAAAVLALSVAALVLGRFETPRLLLTLAVTAGSGVVAGLGAWTGHAGGELVYRHGAASAYTGGATPGGLEAPGEDEEHGGRGRGRGRGGSRERGE